MPLDAVTLACLDPATTNVLPPLMVLVVGVTVTVPVPPAIMSKLHVANVLVACGRVTATALALVLVGTNPPGRYATAVKSSTLLTATTPL